MLAIITPPTQINAMATHVRAAAIVRAVGWPDRLMANRNAAEIVNTANMMTQQPSPWFRLRPVLSSIPTCYPRARLDGEGFAFAASAGRGRIADMDANRREEILRELDSQNAAIKAVGGGANVPCDVCGKPLVLFGLESGRHPGIFCETGCTAILFGMERVKPRTSNPDALSGLN